MPSRQGPKVLFASTSPSRYCASAFSVCTKGRFGPSSQELQWILKSLAAREPIHVVNALGIPLLTEREEQIVQLVAEGLPSKEIAAKLAVSAHTVKNHLFRIYEKLGVSNRSELILYALSSRQNKASRMNSQGNACANPCDLSQTMSGLDLSAL